MGLGGISIWQLLIVLLIVVMIFGTKKLRGTGSDLGAAIKGFRKSVKESTDEEDGKTESLEGAKSETLKEGDPEPEAEKEKA